MTRLDRDTASFLFELRVRGLLALMFSERQVQPTIDQFAMLTGNQEITLRDIGEIAFDLSFDVQLLSRQICFPEPETAPEEEEV